MRHVSLLTLLLLLSTPAAAGAPPLAVKALETLDAFENDAWTYTRTTKDKEGTRIERHDASKPEGARWTLLRVDGRAATAKEQEAFRKERADMEKRRGKESDDDQDVDLDSIRLVSETPERATFSFRTRGKSGVEARMAKNVAGTLVVNKAGGWAERFELRSTGTIAPVPGVKVSAFRLVMTFQRHAGSTDIVPAAIELSMRGRAFMVKSLDEDRTTRYSDFLRVR